MSFEGKYSLTIKTPMGEQTGNLVVAQEGDTLSGTMEQGGDIQPIEDGKVDGDTASWDLKVTKPMPLTLSFTASKDGDNISGKVKLGAFGESTFEGVAV